jgi:membrane protein implicated in regulation of membrane protease activity
MTANYFWWILGVGLIAVEMLAPGFFLMWIGFAALAMGVVTLFLPTLGGVAQVLLFTVFALASCYVWWRIMRRRGDDAPDAASTLNRRGDMMIGRRYVLETAIENGRGKARVGDSLWLVEGPDLPAGANVEVTGVHGATLVVRAA